MMESLRTWLLVLTVVVPAIGCSDADDAGPMVPDASRDVAPEASPSDASLDAWPDASADLPDAATMDAPKPWPEPGVLYLTKLTSQADFDKIRQNRIEVPFFMRRRGNDLVYPYPWDRHECIFHVPISHLEFLRQLDPERAVQLYLVDAKTMDGNLIPGRFIVEGTNPPVATVLFENTVGLMSTPVFTLEAPVAAQIRERFKRCAPFLTSFKFMALCPDGTLCALPE